LDSSNSLSEKTDTAIHARTTSSHFLPPARHPELRQNELTFFIWQIAAARLDLRQDLDACIATRSKPGYHVSDISHRSILTHMQRVATGRRLQSLVSNMLYLPQMTGRPKPILPFLWHFSLFSVCFL